MDCPSEGIPDDCFVIILLHCELLEFVHFILSCRHFFSELLPNSEILQQHLHEITLQADFPCGLYRQVKVRAGDDPESPLVKFHLCNRECRFSISRDGLSYYILRLILVYRKNESGTEMGDSGHVESYNLWSRTFTYTTRITAHMSQRDYFVQQQMSRKQMPFKGVVGQSKWVSVTEDSRIRGRGRRVERTGTLEGNFVLTFCSRDVADAKGERERKSEEMKHEKESEDSLEQLLMSRDPVLVNIGKVYGFRVNARFVRIAGRYVGDSDMAGFRRFAADWKYVESIVEERKGLIQSVSEGSEEQTASPIVGRQIVPVWIGMCHEQGRKQVLSLAMLNGRDLSLYGIAKSSDAVAGYRPTVDLSHVVILPNPRGEGTVMLYPSDSSLVFLSCETGQPVHRINAPMSTLDERRDGGYFYRRADHRRLHGSVDAENPFLVLATREECVEVWNVHISECQHKLESRDHRGFRYALPLRTSHRNRKIVGAASRGIVVWDLAAYVQRAQTFRTDCSCGALSQLPDSGEHCFAGFVDSCFSFYNTFFLLRYSRVSPNSVAFWDLRTEDAIMTVDPLDEEITFDHGILEMYSEHQMCVMEGGNAVIYDIRNAVEPIIVVRALIDARRSSLSSVYRSLVRIGDGSSTRFVASFSRIDRERISQFSTFDSSGKVSVSRCTQGIAYCLFQPCIGSGFEMEYEQE